MNNELDKYGIIIKQDRIIGQEQIFIDKQIIYLYIEELYYQLRLSNKSKEKSYIEFIQENSIEFQVQDSLSYILQTIVCVHITTNLL